MENKILKEYTLNSMQNSQKTSEDDKDSIPRLRHFKCEICTETFIRSKHLKNHKKKKHSGEPRNKNSKIIQAETKVCSFNLYSILQKAVEETNDVTVNINPSMENINPSMENINPSMETGPKIDTQCTLSTNPSTPGPFYGPTPASPASRGRRKGKVPLSSHYSMFGLESAHSKLGVKKGRFRYSGCSATYQTNSVTYHKDMLKYLTDLKTAIKQQ